jgi:hypothetical protein
MGIDILLVPGDKLPVPSTTAVVKDSTDSTKQIDFDASGITTGNTRTIIMPDTDVDLADIATNTAASHAESHTVASHSDTTATGAELEELTDGSETTLHSHAGGGGGTTWLFAYKASTETVASSTTLQNDDDIVIAVAANSVYHFELDMTWFADASPDIKYGWSVPSGATMQWSNGSAVGGATTLTEASVKTENGGTKLTRIRGEITTVGTAGNLQFQWAQNSSHATGTQVKAGTNIVALKLN